MILEGTRFLRVCDLSRRMGISRKQVYRAMDEGYLEWRMIFGKRYVSEDVLNEFIEGVKEGV